MIISARVPCCNRRKTHWSSPVNLLQYQRQQSIETQKEKTTISIDQSIVSHCIDNFRKDVSMCTHSCFGNY